jgi:hypothetical protein
MTVVIAQILLERVDNRVEMLARAGLTSLRQGYGGPPTLQRRRKAGP